MAEYDDNDLENIAYAKEYMVGARKISPNIAFYIARSKNKNIVVYEVMKKADGEIDPELPVDAYWLDAAPHNMAENRKKGIESDRSELIWIEKKMAYGVDSTPVKDEPGVYQAALVSIPSRPIKIRLVDGVPVPSTDINGRHCNLTFIYVKSRERTFLPPKVVFVDIYGTDIETGEEVHERATDD